MKLQEVPTRFTVLFAGFVFLGLGVSCGRAPALERAAGLEGSAGAGRSSVRQIKVYSVRNKGFVMTEKVIKSEAEWKQILTPEQFQVARKKGTEKAFTGKYWNNHEKGMYRCICCDNALFTSDTKFESGTGWPSFYQPIAAEMLLVNQHPAVRAIAPLFALHDAYTDVAFPGGVHLAWFTESWGRFNALLDFVHDRFAFLVVQRARFGKADAARVAVEQPHLQARLGGRHLLGHGGLGGGELPGRFREAAGLHHAQRVVGAENHRVTAIQREGDLLGASVALAR